MPTSKPCWSGLANTSAPPRAGGLTCWIIQGTVLELGFRPHLDITAPYGFAVGKTVPSVRHLNAILRTLDSTLLAELFTQTVQALLAEIPGLGEVVAYDVKHIYASAQREQSARLHEGPLLSRPSTQG